jgi:hypothetical protein
MRTTEAVAAVVAGAVVVPGAALGFGWFHCGRSGKSPDTRVRPAAMFSNAEVAQAVGAIVEAHGPGPAMRRRETYGPPGSPQRLLTASVAEGWVGRLRMWVRRLRGTRLAGVGDEAYTGDNWVAGRRGGVVILLSQPKHVRWGVPGGLAWLLGTALRRVPDAS